jgi:sulfate permease, SulP family
VRTPLAGVLQTWSGRWWPLTYRRSWVGHDLLAGLTTAAVVIPQAMAYAAIAGLPVEAGLYTACVPMAAYALAGSSRALSVSVTSSIAAVTAAAIAGSPDPVAAARALALYAGLFLVAGSLLRVGYVADLISAPVLTGFKVGIGVSIAVGQLDSLLGVTIDQDRMLGQLWAAITSLPDADPATLAVSGACVAVLLAGKRWLPSIPASLVVVAAGIAASMWWNFDQHGIALIGDVPSGFPAPSLPHLQGTADLVVPALGVALISFVESTAAARAFQASSDKPVSADRDLGALGLANLVSSVFRGMPAGGGMSQTAVNDQSGARSPLAAVWSAATVVLALVLLAPLFSYLPTAVLGALVFVAAIGLVDLPAMRRIFAVRRRDGYLAVLAAAFVITAGALDGILAAVLISVLVLLFELSRLPLEIVHEIPHDSTATRRVPPDVLVLRPRSDVYFANVQRFRREVLAAVDAADPRPAAVVVDAANMSVLEFTAEQSLRELVTELRAANLEAYVVLPPGRLSEAHDRFLAVFSGNNVGVFPDLQTALDEVSRP